MSGGDFLCIIILCVIDLSVKRQTLSKIVESFSGIPLDFLLNRAAVWQGKGRAFNTPYKDLSRVSTRKIMKETLNDMLTP